MRHQKFTENNSKSTNNIYDLLLPQFRDVRPCSTSIRDVYTKYYIIRTCIPVPAQERSEISQFMYILICILIS